MLADNLNKTVAGLAAGAILAVGAAGADAEPRRIERGFGF